MPLSLPSRSLLVFLADVGVVVVAWVVAYLLRFNFELPTEFRPGLWLGLGVGAPVAALCFRYFGLYRGIWVFASLPDLLRIGRAVGVAGLVVPALVMVVFHSGPVIPRSVFILQPILLLVFMGAAGRLPDLEGASPLRCIDCPGQARVDPRGRNGRCQSGAGVGALRRMAGGGLPGR